MARLVLLACLMLSAVSVSAAHNWLDVEHCSEDCTGHCGKKTRYITGKCVDNEGDAPGSYKATCTPGGAWKVEFFMQKGCTGGDEPALGSEKTCDPFADKLPVTFVSSTAASNQVVVKICDKIPNGDSENCDAETCKEKTLSTNTKCEKVDAKDYHYTAKVTGDDDASATLTLGLYDDAKLCEAAVAPVFYKENMAKDECVTYRQALKGTCTPMTRTHTVTQPTTTSTSSTSTSTNTESTSTTDGSTSANTDGSSDSSSSNNSDNDTDGNNTSSAVSSSLAAVLLAVLAVLVALY